MAKTIRWPPEIVDGRLAWTADPSEAIRQIVRLTFTAGNTANPFLTSSKVQAFRGLERNAEAELRDRVAEVFRGLEREKRARLTSLQTRRERASGELWAVIEYEDLESSRRERLEGRIDGA